MKTTERRQNFLWPTERFQLGQLLIAQEYDPKLFSFYFWLKPLPQKLHLAHYICLKSCIEINNPDKIFFYYKKEPYGRYWEKIKDKLELVNVKPIKMLNEEKLGYAHQADFIRLEMLNKYGGIYADIDTIFIKKIPESMRENEFVMGLEDLADPYAGLGNAIIMAEVGSFLGLLGKKHP